MHRIDGPGHVNNRWVAEDAATSRPPTEFTAEFTNAIQEEFCSFIEWAGLVLNKADNTQLRQAILAKFGAIYSISALPTANKGPIIVAETGEVWIWSASAYYTGYRSPLCGRPMDGHTTAPLVSEVSAVGGTLSKTAYAGLWGYAQENGLVLTQANWTANIGGHYFVDVDAGNFRGPDLRNVFRRYSGTDADTSAARALGSYKADTLRSHSHGTGYQVVTLNGLYGPNSGGTFASAATPGTVTGNTGTAETAPKHTAFNPVIHI